MSDWHSKRLASKKKWNNRKSNKQREQTTSTSKSSSNKKAVPNSKSASQNSRWKSSSGTTPQNTNYRGHRDGSKTKSQSSTRSYSKREITNNAFRFQQNEETLFIEEKQDAVLLAALSEGKTNIPRPRRPVFALIEPRQVEAAYSNDQLLASLKE